jgi:hypothetical protein
MAKNELKAAGGDGDEMSMNFMALRPDSDIREALEANLRGGESINPGDLPRVPTPAGGGKVWNWTDTGNNEQTAKSLDGLLVFCGYRGTLWGSEEPQGKVSPVLVSYDLVTAVRVNDEIGDLDAEVLESCRIGDRMYDWRRLPYNQYGTSKSGRGKRCKESRLLGVLRQDEAWPLLVTAGPGSLKTVTPFVKRLPVPHYRAVVSLTLERVENAGGQPYSQIVPKFVGAVSKEMGTVVRRIYTDPLNAIGNSIDVSAD